MSDTSTGASGDAGTQRDKSETSPRVIVFCDADALRANLSRAFGSGYADIDPQALAERVAADRGWTLAGVRIYVPGAAIRADDAAEEAARGRWAEKAKATSARVLTQSGAAPVRIALDVVEAVQTQAADIVMAMGGGDALIPLAEAIHTMSHGRATPLKFASLHAPSGGPFGHATPGADISVAVGREIVERSLFLASGPRPERRIIAGTVPTSQPVVRPAPPARPRRLRALYGMGFAATFLILIWEDVVGAGVTQALNWSEWRWGVSIVLAGGKALVWPLLWIGRLFGIEAGG